MVNREFSINHSNLFAWPFTKELQVAGEKCHPVLPEFYSCCSQGLLQHLIMYMVSYLHCFLQVLSPQLILMGQVYLRSAAPLTAWSWSWNIVGTLNTLCKLIGKTGGGLV